MRRRSRASRVLASMLSFAVLSAAVPAAAMTLSVRGQQIVATGRIIPADVARFKELIAKNPQIRAIVFEDSAGGSSRAADRITPMIEGASLDTVAEGFCISACAMLFLSGANRTFGDIRPLARTSIGFHGSYAGPGKLAPAARLSNLRNRVIDRTQGKIDPNLLDEWLHLPDQRKTVRFVYPQGITPASPSVYLCPRGRFANAGDYDRCRAIKGTDALRSGIITSTNLTHINT